MCVCEKRNYYSLRLKTKNFPFAMLPDSRSRKKESLVCCSSVQDTKLNLKQSIQTKLNLVQTLDLERKKVQAAVLLSEKLRRQVPCVCVCVCVCVCMYMCVCEYIIYIF